MNLLQQQNIENALYTIDSSSFGATAREIWESIGFVFKKDYQDLTVEEFAYKRMHYRYEFTTSEEILMEDVDLLSVFELDLECESPYFIAVNVSYSGNEKQKIEQVKYIAEFLSRLSDRHCHYLFKMGRDICFTSLIQIEKREDVFKHANLRKKGTKVLPQYEYKFITSEWFSFFMDKEKWDVLYSISMEDYVASFVREVEIANYSAEYIIYELEPVADGYKMQVGELNLYCKNVMYELFGDEWFADNHIDYANEIRKEKLSDEDWDLIEFELEGQEDNPMHEDETWDEDWDEEEDYDYDEIPDDIVDDPVALLEWIETHKEKTWEHEPIRSQVNSNKETPIPVSEKHGTLVMLLESVDYKLPIDVHKDNWTRDYHFVITSVRNGYAHGDIYIGNRYQKQSSYPIDKPYHTYRFYQG